MDISLIRQARSRSVSAENLTGEPGRGGMAAAGTGQGAARDLGVGWKVSPSVVIGAGARVTLADISGPGVVRHIWLTTAPQWWRRMVFRAHWDDDPRRRCWCRWATSSGRASPSTRRSAPSL